jgi:hypothetical protein
VCVILLQDIKDKNLLRVRELQNRSKGRQRKEKRRKRRKGGREREEKRERGEIIAIQSFKTVFN